MGFPSLEHAALLNISLLILSLGIGSIPWNGLLVSNFSCFFFSSSSLHFCSKTKTFFFFFSSPFFFFFFLMEGIGCVTKNQVAKPMRIHFRVKLPSQSKIVYERHAKKKTKKSEIIFCQVKKKEVFRDDSCASTIANDLHEGVPSTD